MRITSILIFCVLFLYVVSFTSACKKSHNTQPDSNFSFTYNGVRHVLPLKEGTAEWGTEMSGIYINRADLFHGTVHFPYANCAYLEPVSYVSSITLEADCQLSANGPIDSLAVYLYHSGTVSLSYRNCSRKSEYDPYTGTYYSYEVCDIIGTFDLTLKNTANEMIVITEGRIEEYRKRMY